MIKTLESPLKKYHSLGILKAGELLLQPTDAILAVNNLEQLGILILGVDLWYNQGSDFAEDPNSLDLSDVNDVNQNADSAREFITHHLPKRTTWVSLVFFEESTPATKTEPQSVIISILQQFDDQERNQFFHRLNSLPQNNQEEFIDLLLNTPSREEQRQLIQVFSKPKSKANLGLVASNGKILQSQQSKPKSKANLGLVASNGKILQSQQPHQPQAGWKPTRTVVNKAA
jgi:hypothetical protein